MQRADLQQVEQLLRQELAKPLPCIATASIALGVLQQRLLQPQTVVCVFQDQVAEFQLRFQEQLLQPTAARASKAKTPQDKVLAVAKLLGTKLAKAPAHKQPLHAQYLPSALQDGKRQLDCVGIATTVLALVQQLGQQLQEAGDPAGDALAGCALMVSDDHCWLVLEANGAQQHLEVTSCKALTADQMKGWLYAGGHGLKATPQQVVLLLVAQHCPEEVSQEAAAQQLREAQLHLLQVLSASFPAALSYSNHYRWGLLLQDAELQQIQAAADRCDLQQLQQLVQEACPPSQHHFAISAQLSAQWQWHPVSCSAYGWLERLAALLYGTGEQLLAAAARDKAAEPCAGTDVAGSSNGASGSTAAAIWPLACCLLQRALDALQPAAAVLRRYQREEHTKSDDQELRKDTEDLLEWWVEAFEALVALQQLVPAGFAVSAIDHRTAEVGVDVQMPKAGAAAEAAVGAAQATAADAPVPAPAAAAAGAAAQPAPPAGAAGGAAGGVDAAAAAGAAAQAATSAAASHQAGGVPAVGGTNAGQCGGSAAAAELHEQLPDGHKPTVDANAAQDTQQDSSTAPTVEVSMEHGHHHQQQQHAAAAAVPSALNQVVWLGPLLALFDAMCCYYGDSGTVPQQSVDYLLQCAACFTTDARAAAAVAAGAAGEFCSTRLQAALLTGPEAAASNWVGLDVGLRGQLHLPTSRKKRRC